MKRFGDLYPNICTFDNLLQAFYKARKGKRKNSNVAAFEANLEYELLQLLQELKIETYHPGPYRTFYIQDPKKRMISAAPFRDRVVHHALCNIIEPIFEPTFIFDTYANRKGKGTHTAIRRCQSFMRQYKYVLKADIRKYFPSIDHAILKGLIARKIKCPRTLSLVDLIIDNSNPQELAPDYFPGDDLFSLASRRRGLPMGNLTSQFFANLYLSPFDHFVKEELGIKGYIRYVDDVVLFHDDKSLLHELKKECQRFLSKRLRLLLHPKKSEVFPTASGLTFLGQRIFLTHRRLKRENVQRFYRRMKERLALYHAEKLSPEQLECQLNSWLGHARQADTWRLRKRCLKGLQEGGVKVLERRGEVWVVLG